MIYCTFCGKQIEDDAAFCGHCGKPVTQKDMLAELVAAARMGSQDAISTLYEKTYSKVYYTVRSMIKDEDTAFDIVQDTYIKAFTHLNSFQGDTHFLPWIRQIAANTARDWLKKKRPVLFTEFSSDKEQDTPIEELLLDERSENLPDKVIDQKETERLIREIIEELPEDQHAVIGMFYYEEMSVKEIAAAMDASESAVKSRLMYGRNKIEKKIRELEKKGTKLYGLSPLPFLLLLFYNQKAYAAKAPAGRILHTILASVSTDVTSAAEAAKNAGTVGAGQTGTAGAGQAGATGVGQAGTAGAGQAGATGVGQAGTAGAGQAGAAGAAAAGGLGTLKIGLITVATIVVVGLGIFGVTRIASHSDESWNPLTVEDATDNGTAETPKETDAPEEPEIQEESTPIDEALEQYRIIIGQADSYEYYEHEMNQWTELSGYRYALVQMHPDDPVPTLLLERDEIDIEISVPSGYVRIFQYDPNTKTVRQPTETIGIGIRGGISMAGDGEGIFDTQWSGGTGQGSVSRITLEGDSLNQETYWTGQIFEMPDSITSTEIEWHEIEDLSALDSFTAPEADETAPSGQAAEGTLPTDGERIVLSGTVGTYDYDGIVTLQKQPDPNAAFYDDASREFVQSLTYRVIVLDTPQTLSLHVSGEEKDYYSSHEALMLSIDDADGMEQYEGQHITFSIDPTEAYWPSDTSLPFGQPVARDIHVLD